MPARKHDVPFPMTTDRQHPPDVGGRMQDTYERGQYRREDASQTQVGSTFRF